MIEEDYLGDEGILIVFEGDIERKEIELVDFGVLEGNLTLSEDLLVKNDHHNEEIAYSGEFHSLESVGSSRD